MWNKRSKVIIGPSNGTEYTTGSGLVGGTLSSAANVPVGGSS